MERYSRQILFSGIGEAGQRRLLESRVTLIGCGALGCALAEMLARAGVGFIRLVDRDFIEWSNLNRQVLFTEADAEARMPKAIAAQNRLRAINSEIEVTGLVTDVNVDTVESLVAGADLVLDGTDNFETRYLVNDACVKAGIPWIYGAAVGAYGMTMTIVPGETPCLRCIFEEMPPVGTAQTCDTAGIILPIIQTVTAAQVSEALKLLTGQKEKLRGTLLHIDLWDNSYRNVKLSAGSRNPECPCCGQRRFEFLAAAHEALALSLCGRNSVQIRPAKSVPLDFVELEARLVRVGTVRANEHLLVFRTDDHEMTLFRDGRAIVKGTSDVQAARGFYAKYVGS
jgi:molybdopterin-synthase adenylyltransferase